MTINKCLLIVTLELRWRASELRGRTCPAPSRTGPSAVSGESSHLFRISWPKSRNLQYGQVAMGKLKFQ